LSRLPHNHFAVAVLPWLVASATLFGLAFTLHPVRTSHTVFVAAIFAAVFALVVGGGVFARGITGLKRRPGNASKRRRSTLAQECRRFCEALEAFIAERDRERPKPGRWSQNDAREHAWRSATERRYRDELRGWAVRVFEEGLASEVIVAAARPLVQSPPATRLRAVCDLFRDAALTLEGS
jgi:hypothetical protein